MTRQGFTLAELLIALGILGVIATFTIPKVLSVQQDARKKAVIKEVVAILNQITYLAYSTRDPALTPDTFFAYFRDHMNTVKVCAGDVNDEQCWTQQIGSPDAYGFQGFVLHNGATLTSFTQCCDLGNGQIGNMISVDWNGAEGPNVFGDDQFDLVLSWGTAPITDWGNPPYRPGTVMPDNAKASSVALFKQVFQ